MPEAEKEKFERELRVYEEKDIQNYAVQLNAWFNTKLEKDKSIITISSAAVGLLVTILTTKGVHSFCQVVFYFFAFASFLVAIITAVNILDKNAEQIEKDLTGNGNINAILGRSDLIIKLSFYSGIIFTILLGISYGANQFLNDLKEKKVAEENSKPKREDPIFESFTGSNKLKPSVPAPQKDTPKKEK